jgi:TPP-dependent indolepyruvate ferredoxin oxidoreductase alpha subunit
MKRASNPPSELRAKRRYKEIVNTVSLNLEKRETVTDEDYFRKKIAHEIIVKQKNEESERADLKKAQEAKAEKDKLIKSLTMGGTITYSYNGMPLPVTPVN